MKKTKDTNSNIGKEEKEKLYVKVTADKLHRRNLITRIVLIAVTGILLFISVVYGVLYIVNSSGNFTISLDPNLKATKHIEISPYSNFSETSLTLRAKALEYMDNISELWLPENIDSFEGEHSGDNYIAYSFFVKNDGEESANYETYINVLSVIKDVDEAVRVAVYRNGEKTVYAKLNSSTNSPEPNTIPFISNRQVMYNSIDDFQPGAVDKYTIVIWLEGDDPQCIDDIIGGELKLKMFIKERQGN